MANVGRGRGRGVSWVGTRVFALVAAVVTISTVAISPGGARSSSESPVDPPVGAVPAGHRGGSAAASNPRVDTRPYARPLGAGDVLARPALPAGYVLVDPIVSNTNPNLKNTDTFGDSEPYLAVNANNTNRIVISGFSSSWALNGNAALFVSTNGGTTWTKSFSIPPPTGVARTGCPCDQVLDYDRSGRLLGTFLNEASNSGDVYTGSTTNPASAGSWSWRSVSGVAQKTDNPGANNADQPWLRVTRDPVTAAQDNAFVAYDDFTRGDLKVSVSRGANPPNMATTRSIGLLTGSGINPGTRLAPDHRIGTMYAVYQYATGRNADGSAHIWYALNRSANGGSTWTLNGSTSGFVAAQGNSDQPTPKFGTVNALLGGVDSVNVDPRNGAVYVVYGYKSSAAKNLLAIVRYVRDSSGGLTLVSNRFVTGGALQTALPSVAVASNGTVGVLYDTFDGFNASGFPVFSAHLAQSVDQGLTFTDVKLLAFASPEKNNSDPRQRVLGDYQSLRVAGNTFYGTFVANGAQFGRSISNTDPIFFKAPAK